MGAQQHLPRTAFQNWTIRYKSIPAPSRRRQDPGESFRCEQKDGELVSLTCVEVKFGEQSAANNANPIRVNAQAGNGRYGFVLPSQVITAVNAKAAADIASLAQQAQGA